MTCNKIITCTIICLFSISLFGQDNQQEFKRWAFHSNAGYATSFKKLKSGDITDYLIDYDDEYFYWQFITVEYLFKNNFGINLSIQGNKFTDAEQRGNLMDAELEERYGDDYFISTSPYRYHQSKNINPNLYLGVVYAKRFKRISFVPKFQIGFTSFTTNRLNVYMKDIGSNKQLQIVYDYNDSNSSIDNFTFMTGILTEFKIAENLTFDFNVQSYFFRTQFKYKEEIRNTYTEDKSFREFEYNKFLGTFSIGFGIGYKL